MTVSPRYGVPVFLLSLETHVVLQEKLIGMTSYYFYSGYKSVYQFQKLWIGFGNPINELDYPIY